VTNHEKLSIAYILANANFDVWIGNSRGNKYSREHKRLSPESPQFWDFSFHEMGIYDLPATLDFILSKNTSTNKIIYMGHSQGGSMIFSALTQRLEYFKTRLLCVIGLAPATRLNNLTSNVVKASSMLAIDEILNNNNIFEILPHQKNMNSLQDLMIKLYPTMSYALLEDFSDENSLVNCPERFKVYLYRYPAGASLRCCKHFKQIYNAKRFQYYDYEDKSKNVEVYGSEEVPEYDLKAIEGIPIVICGGENDKLTSIEDMRWLREEVKGTLFNYHEYKLMGHASFLISNDIVWFNDVLKDIYKIVEINKK